MNFEDRLISILLESRRLHGGRHESRQARKARQRRPEDSSSAELSTDPNWFGATLEGTPKSKKRVVSLKKLKGFEPDEKMESPEARATIDKYKRAIQSGEERRRPVTVGNTVIDGHHRRQAHKELGTKKVKTVSPGKVRRK